MKNFLEKWTKINIFVYCFADIPAMTVPINSTQTKLCEKFHDHWTLSCVNERENENYLMRILVEI